MERFNAVTGQIGHNRIQLASSVLEASHPISIVVIVPGHSSHSMYLFTLYILGSEPYVILQYCINSVCMSGYQCPNPAGSEINCNLVSGSESVIYFASEFGSGSKSSSVSD